MNAAAKTATNSATATGPSRKSIGLVLGRAARLHRTRLGQLLADLGLFPGQEQVLGALAAQEAVGQPDGPAMGMGALATQLGVRPPTVSKAIGRLEAQGLVERVAGQGDARGVGVRLTQAGRTKAAALDSLWRMVETQMLDGFDGKDRKRLRKLLRRLAANLDQRSPDEPGAEDDEDEAPAA
jgi:DNA-binding MarR family transcriptional regulator